MEFVNESSNEFADISSEEYREYCFPNNECIRIEDPIKLSVSKSGGHRLLSNDGISHYVPSGWIHLMWKSKEGKPNFVM